MDYLPLFHNLRGRRCVVIGAGGTALRKLRMLLDAGATIEIVATAISSDTQQFTQAHGIPVRLESYRTGMLNGAILVIAATSDCTCNQLVSADAQRLGIPVNVVDDPELCTVIFPSIIDRSPVLIAISSGGHAPVLARVLRTRLESLIPASFGHLAALAGKFRALVKQHISELSARTRFWENALQGTIAELVYAGRESEAEQRLLAQLNASLEDTLSGEVYLVGAGPGDPDLLTFKALRLMQQADVVLYDRLVSKEVLGLVRRDAQLYYVGKTAGEHPVTQDNINQKLVDLARLGKRVLRLKGGDPFIFGRGGEEIAHLAEQGIAFQVVPGITAASGCASYAGIPLTHRDYATSVQFIAGHRREGQLDLNWSHLAAPNQTLVFYMGLNGLETICERLVAHGMDAQTPAALIEKGTSLRQRVIDGNLGNLAARVRGMEARAPTLIIVGGVVGLRKQLSWFGLDVVTNND